MQIILTQDEKLKIVYDCLTTGMPNFPGYGFSLNYNKEEYKQAKQTLVNAPDRGDDTICIEDVQIEMIRQGFDLTFTDEEGEGENDAVLNLKQIEKNWDKVPATHIIAMCTDDGDWDADTADIVMQNILFGEVTFG